ncbi:MAG: YlxR family protein [Actinomycetota bacterium]
MAQSEGNTANHGPGATGAGAVTLRSCCACRAKRPKQELLRFARAASGRVMLDPSGYAAGRGGYICRSKVCLDAALKRGSLARTLKSALTGEQLVALRCQCAGYLGVEE